MHNHYANKSGYVRLGAHKRPKPYVFCLRPWRKNMFKSVFVFLGFSMFLGFWVFPSFIFFMFSMAYGSNKYDGETFQTRFLKPT